MADSKRGDRDRLSNLPDEILIHILSMLPKSKAVVRTSVLSKRWQFMWKSVPVSLYFVLPGHDEKKATDFVVSTHRELHYWRYCRKIRKLEVIFSFGIEDFAKDVDFWVHFATKIANVEDFKLEYCLGYELPQIAYKNTSLKKLGIQYCTLNPSGSVNWSSLLSLSFGNVELKDDAMEKVLLGCPDLECLELDDVEGIHPLEISNLKLRKLIIKNCENEESVPWLEILAPNVQNLQLLGVCGEIRLRQSNVDSLVTAVLDLKIEFGEGVIPEEKAYSCLKKLLHSVAHVENLELGPWCIECLSILELKGWKSPPSSRKFLKLDAALEQLDLPGVCSFLQSSLDLETLVIDWYNQKGRYHLLKYPNEDELNRRFETHNFNSSLLHLKTIKINFYGPLSENRSVQPLVKYLLKHAIVLEKFVIAARYRGSEVSRDYVNMEQEFLSFPRSSPHASIVFSY
uniref:F-box protein At5g03100-like n=1 Tax=Nicotiana tabacum TaxID=4097 RepID=A0A1S4C118_TOBAC|nr:PREDICTED: F-box protein At5g03100-like [Nicotiana tabacum]